MNNLRLFAAFIALFTLASCGGSHISGNESYKYRNEQIEDTKIMTQVLQGLRGNNLIPHKNIHVAIDRGVVQLSGFVRDYAEADLAILTVGKVNGVKHVINAMVVLSSAEYATKRAAVEAQNAAR